MGLFKEFKDDFSQAVNELVPGDVPEKEVEPKAQTADNLVVDTIGENVDVASELSKLDGLLEHSVVLLHDDSNRSTTAEAIEPLVESIKAQGAEILPIDNNTYKVQYIKSDTVG